MRPWQLGTVLMLGMVSLTGSSAVRLTAALPDGAVAWMSDYEAARAESRRSGRPLFVAFR